jgi:hypothetical protein
MVDGVETVSAAHAIDVEDGSFHVCSPEVYGEK